MDCIAGCSHGEVACPRISAARIAPVPTCRVHMHVHIYIFPRVECRNVTTRYSDCCLKRCCSYAVVGLRRASGQRTAGIGLGAPWARRITSAALLHSVRWLLVGRGKGNALAESRVVPAASGRVMPNRPMTKTLRRQAKHSSIQFEHQKRRHSPPQPPPAAKTRGSTHHHHTTTTKNAPPW